MQFYQVSTTFIALELVAPAQIEKKVDFIVSNRFTDYFLDWLFY